jgi:hypothetical protein
MKIPLALILLIISPGVGSVRASAAGFSFLKHAQQPQAANKQGDSIPTIGFCEMVKNAKLYFDKPVRVVAKYQMATEGRYFSDDKCPLSHDDQIGAGEAMLSEGQGKVINLQLRKVSTSDYGGRALVTVVGILRNSSRRDFWWYQYRFDIVSLEEIAPVTVPYEGELQATQTYQANVRADVHYGLALVPALNWREHYATRIEWINLRAFPKLKRLKHKPSEQRILFTVLSDEIRQMTELRWNRTLRCKIIRIE